MQLTAEVSPKSSRWCQNHNKTLQQQRLSRKIMSLTLVITCLQTVCYRRKGTLLDHEEFVSLIRSLI